MRDNDLIIVMPVFNEEEAIKPVINEWYLAISKCVEDFLFLVLNDGSTDSTQLVLSKLENEYNNLEVINKTNEGHGETCIYGYKKALKIETKWIFQIDSDGQCDPKYFQNLWEKRKSNEVVFGHRITREDGEFRKFVTFIEKIVVFLTTGEWIKDPNVPYRLFKSYLVKDILENFPKNFGLSNILLSVILSKKADRINHVDINFRQRFGGEPSVKVGGFFTKGFDLFMSLLKSRNYIKNCVKK